MRPIRVSLAGAALGLVLVWPIAHATNAAHPTGASAVIVAAVPPGRSGQPTAATGQSAPPPAVSAPVVVVGTGPVVPNRYGPVQVQVTLTDGKITDATALKLPSGGQSGQISRFAGPRLGQEALAAQSAQVDTVSGATYTSDSYRASLQSALDAARAAINTAGS
jgi:uncharacterized protein with FMN-binding domain